MPWRKVCFLKRASLYCSCLMCFFTTFSFTPFTFLVFFHQPPGLNTSLGAGQHTLRLLARRTRLSTFPEPFCWLSCTKGGPGGSRMCHRGFCSGPCPCIHPLSGSQREGCQCLCRGAAALSVLRLELACYSTNRTSDALRCRGCPCPHTQTVKD